MVPSDDRDAGTGFACIPKESALRDRNFVEAHEGIAR
jgi:hypothetical protein